MPIKIKNCAESYLTGAVVPSLGKSTPASYKFVIEKVKKLCADNNLNIVEEKYKSTSDQAYASGVYILAPSVIKPEALNYELVFAWSSSYTRITKFQCGFGVKFKNSPYPDNYVISDDAVEVVKRYKDDPEGATEVVLNNQFSNWESLYYATIFQLEKMSKLTVDKLNLSRIIGTLYFEDLINNKQLTLIKDRIVYGEPMSYRALFASITSTMYDLHPKLWLETQASVYLNFVSEVDLISKYIDAGEIASTPLPTESLDLSKPDPAQLDLLTAIEEVEKEQVVEDQPVIEEPKPEVVAKGDDLDVKAEDTEDDFFNFDL